MPTPANSYNQIPSQKQEFYDRVLLERITPELVFMQHGQQNSRSIPQNEGDTINFRKFNSLPITTEPLKEGVTPAGKNISVSQIVAKVYQYGDYVMVSDWLDLVGFDPVITETTEVLSEQAQESLETLVRDKIFAGTNVYYVGEHTERGDVESGDTLKGSDVRRARQIMARNQISHPQGENAYIGFVHPDAAYDIKGDSEWTDAAKYGDPERLFNGEIGRLHGIRWVETTMCPIWEGAGSGGTDVYGSLILGANAFGVVDINGGANPTVIVKNKGSAGTGDPLDQRSTIGWKANMTCVRLNELAMLRLEHAAGL